MSRESAFSSMDNSNYNAALTDYFGGLGRAIDPQELEKKNQERQEFNERLNAATGAISGPFLDQGIHGVTKQVVSAVKNRTARELRAIANKVGLTPEALEEQANRLGLNLQEMRDIASGKKTFTDFAARLGTDARERLQNAANNLRGNVAERFQAAGDAAEEGTGSVLDNGLSLRNVANKQPLEAAKLVPNEPDFFVPGTGERVDPFAAGKDFNDGIADGKALNVDFDVDNLPAPPLKASAQLRRVQQLSANRSPRNLSKLANSEDAVEALEQRGKQNALGRLGNDVPLKDFTPKGDVEKANPFSYANYQETNFGSMVKPVTKTDIQANAARANEDVANTLKNYKLEGLAEKTRLPKGPLEPTQEGFVRQQLKYLNTDPNEAFLREAGQGPPPPPSITPAEEPLAAPAADVLAEQQGLPKPSFGDADVEGSLVKQAIDKSAENEGGDAASTTVNLATKNTLGKAATAVAEQTGQKVESQLPKAAEDAVETALETEAAAGGPEDVVGDVVSLGLGLGTLFGGLAGEQHPQQPTYRRPINPSTVYGI